MLDQGYISINTVISRIKLNPYVKEDFNKITAINLIGQCLKLINIKEVMQHSVELIDITNYKGEIPEGLKRIVQTSYSLNHNYTLSKNCSQDSCEYVTTPTNYKINIQNSGDCSSDNCCKIIVDRQFYERKSYMPVISILDGQERHQGFKPIYPSVNNFGLYLVNKDLNNQYSLSNNESYIVNPEFIETSFKKGQLLMSFLKTPTDDDGYPYIVNDELVLQACEKYYFYKTLSWKVYSGIDPNFSNLMLRTGTVKVMEEEFQTALMSLRGKAKFPNMEQQYMAYKNINTLLPNDNKFNSYYGYY
ncbi:MAG TPA: hypothetical protein PKD00_02490 [Burkholderiales bacterium]|nr:hypothetical protein [Burkholderiales bacterium]